MLAPKELRAIHPLGKSPVITDNGNTIAESGAIIDYIVDTYGDGRLIPPPKTPQRLRYTYFLHYAEGSAMFPLLLKLIFSLMPRRAPALMRPMVNMVSNKALTTRFVMLARIAQLLERHGLEAVLIGNAAAALQGTPVTTIDVDFLFRKTPANLKKLKAIASDLGAVILRPYYPVSGLFRIVRDDDGLQFDF